MSQYDANSIYDYLANTPEGGLRKMLVDGKPMTDVHFGLLIKIVRACKVEEFAEHFSKQDFPKVKFGPAETKIKEKFWNDCLTTFKSRGLLNPADPKKVA